MAWIVVGEASTTTAESSRIARMRHSSFMSKGVDCRCNTLGVKTSLLGLFEPFGSVVSSVRELCNAF
jgi:hypothetical protein